MTKNLEAGIKYYNMRRWDTAFSTLHDGAEESPASEKTEFFYYMGLTCMKLERYEEALQYLEQVVTHEDSLPARSQQCRLILAYIYMITRRARMAEFELKILLKNGYNVSQVMALMAYAAYQQKNPERACELYGKALEIDGNNVTALNSLGYILADTETDIARALQYCKKAVDKKPQNAAFLDSLGWAYFKMGNVEEAKAWVRRALDLSPHTDEIKAHMKAIVGETA